MKERGYSTDLKRIDNLGFFQKMLITVFFSVTFGVLSYLATVPLEKYFSHPELLEYVPQDNWPPIPMLFESSEM